MKNVFTVLYVQVEWKTKCAWRSSPTIKTNPNPDQTAIGEKPYTRRSQQPEAVGNPVEYSCIFVKKVLLFSVKGCKFIDNLEPTHGHVTIFHGNVPIFHGHVLMRVIGIHL